MFWCINCESVVKDSNVCNKCNSNNLVKINNGEITIGELLVLKHISKDVSFIEAMINLKESDPIEYQLKMSQFKTQAEQQSSIKQDNKVHCKYCNSTNVKKISNISKAGSVAMFGIFSKKVHKEWHCNSCNSDF